MAVEIMGADCRVVPPSGTPRNDKPVFASGAKQSPPCWFLEAVFAALLALFAVTGTARADEIRLLAFDTPGGAAEYIAGHPELCSTNIATGVSGSMVWVSCPGDPPVPAGMAVLGGSYTEVLADPAKKAAYETIMPPGHFDADGEFVYVESEDRRFGTFAGREEML